MQFHQYSSFFSWGSIASLLATVIPAQESVLIADNQTGYILHGRSIEHRLHIGTLATIATVAVALDWIYVNRTPLSTLAVVPNGSDFNSILRPGDKISLRDLIYCIILSSDCGAAHTLAEYIGSRVHNPRGLSAERNFVSQMNMLAHRLGMHHTHFLNPGGSCFTKKQQPYSTAVDIARLTHYAHQKAQFRFYASQASRTIQIVRKGVVHSFYLQNTNQFLGYKRIDGVKGNNCCGEINRSHLVLTTDHLPIATQHENRWIIITPRRLLIVLLGSTNCLNDGLASLRYGWRLYDEWITQGRPIREHDFL
ncbi:D-alanyl-D-alanine carboxypeptidase DacB precursor [Candidatus Xiphinematobacter sp. Idaho Grape]|uniref:D-alanyl-D-alanine carboxypeptidase family protein n=1 Tax=Candidatus Xiphinematobacter sp. Idaho Grape TaxID=1704307 RepID=UPI000705844D|nr:D-alanyl-D-alanine carboxypeptidase [Candidatus Xiphinematobacter sp. Idaho Grape]ALJ56333.1 D-alanyl-D-alanine carboxypeptidase DacB precursor [Candidatus Xiphinematobacter sp. Idaho Grape]